MSSDPLLERIPPQDQEAEQAVIGSVLISTDAVVAASGMLQPEDFYRHTHETIFRAVMSLYQAGVPADLVTVSGRLRETGELDDVGGYAYLMDLAASIPTAANVAYYAKSVRDKAILRKAIASAGKIVEDAYNHEGSVADFIDEAEQRILGLNQTYGDGRKNRPMSIASILTTVYDQVEYRYAHQEHITGRPTGYYDLDYMTSGLQPSDLVILAARPAMGKTAFSLDLARNVAKETGDLAVIFSLEMSREQLVQRMLCSEARIDSHRLKTGFLTESDWPKLSEAMGALASIPIWIDDTPQITVHDIRSRARQIKTENKGELSLIVIDYLQLMSGGGTGRGPENRVQEISTISRQLKGLARELNVPIVALSQLSRAVESRADKRPMLSDLRESGSIEQDADIVMFIYRDEYYNPDTVDKNIAEIILAKHRNGPVGKVKLFFENQHTHFGNLTKGSYTE